MREFRPARCATIAAVLVACAPHAATAAGEGTESQSLEQAASDPTASLMSVSVQDIYAGSYHQLDDESGNTLLLRSSVPFTTGSLEHIARATLPIVTNSPSGESGLSDLVLFDLIVFDEPWGRWGIGPVMLAPTATDDAIGADKWSIGTSEMNVTYDWERDAWTVLPLGVKLARLVKFGKLPVQFAGGYEYNFADDYVAPKWTLNFTVKFLFPVSRRSSAPAP